MKATVRVQTDRLIAQASDLLRGHFIEHVHGCMEGGIVDEESSLVDQQGVRTDVRDYFRELKPGILRYPGGNFSCSLAFVLDLLEISPAAKMHTSTVASLAIQWRKWTN